MKSRRNEEMAILRAWFTLTQQERLFLAGLLAIFLVGLTARYLHLKSEVPEPYHPEGLVSFVGEDDHE